MKKNNLRGSITLVDLGTSQCTTMICAPSVDGNDYRVVGLATVESQGIKKSNIVDLVQASNTIKNSLTAAEDMAGVHIDNVYISISGNHISSQNSSGMVAIIDPSQEITASDRERVLTAAQAISLSADRELLYVTPRFFKVDTSDSVEDPVGMVGLKLEADVHLITCGTANIRNLEKCLKDAELGTLDAPIFAGLAAANSTLTKTEKELGVASLNIGAGSTSFCVYVEGTVIHSGCLPIGAYHITRDIAAAFKISFDQAEKIKVNLSVDDFNELVQRPNESREEYRRRRKQADILDAEKLGLPSFLPPISKDYLYRTVISERLKQIFRVFSQELEAKDLLGQISSGGVVLSGGGALTIGVTEVAMKTLNVPARLGASRLIPGVVSDIDNPRYAVIVGLLEHAISEPSARDAASATFEPHTSGGALSKLSNLWKKIMP